MLFAYILLALLGLVMVVKPRAILQIIKGPKIPENSQIEIIWLYKIRYFGWFILVIGLFCIYNIFMQ